MLTLYGPAGLYYYWGSAPSPAPWGCYYSMRQLFFSGIGALPQAPPHGGLVAVYLLLFYLLVLGALPQAPNIFWVLTAQNKSGV